MTEHKILQELDFIIAYATGLKEKATGLRRKLNRVNEGASRKRAAVSPEVMAKVLAKRQKNRIK
jgi:hypothetical protein